MGKNYRLAVAFTSYTLAGTALALPVVGQDADLALTSAPLVLEGTALAIAVVSQDATLSRGGLPSWVPAENAVTTLTVANGLLANTFNSQCAPYYDASSFNYTSATYGGAFKNPYWGTYGCTLFGSGGHGNNNDNSLTVLEYQYDRCEFKRVMDPTPYFGTGTDSTTRTTNSSAGFTTVVGGVSVMGSVDLIPAWSPGDPERSPWVYEYGISTVGGKTRVGSSHTYGARVFIGPDDGGAAHGTLLSLWQAALNRFSQNGIVSAMAVDFASTSTASSDTEWYAHSTERYLEGTYRGTSPLLTAFVPAQKRVYMQTRGGDYGVRWYDTDAATYVTGTGTGFDFWLGDVEAGTYLTEHGALVYVPERDLLLCVYRYSGNVRIQWMDVSVSQPTLGGTATLSSSIPVSYRWGAVTWCSHASRLIAIGTGTDLTRRNTVCEIEIPATLTDTWTVTEITATGTMPDLVSHPAASPGPWQFHYGKRAEYDPGVRAIVYYENRSNQTDTVYVYRPRGT